MADINSRYPMCKDQPAQIDCRVSNCKYQNKGQCSNLSPAITLNEKGTFVCWSKRDKASIWFAVDMDGSEWVYTNKPKRFRDSWSILFGSGCVINNSILSIEVITGKKLSWEDEPLEWHPPR